VGHCTTRTTVGWVRYMLAQQRVERAHDTFVMEWNALKAAKSDAAAMLDRATTLLLAIGKITETRRMSGRHQRVRAEPGGLEPCRFAGNCRGVS
jgi:hypothetical protein